MLDAVGSSRWISKAGLIFLVCCCFATLEEMPAAVKAVLPSAQQNLNEWIVDMSECEDNQKSSSREREWKKRTKLFGVLGRYKKKRVSTCDPDTRYQQKEKESEGDEVKGLELVQYKRVETRPGSVGGRGRGSPHGRCFTYRGPRN